MATAHHDVEFERQCPIRFGAFQVELRHQQRPGGRRNRVVYRVLEEQRVVGKCIWVTRRWGNARPKTEKWICAGRHALWWLPHRYGPGFTVMISESGIGCPSDSSSRPNTMIFCPIGSPRWRKVRSWSPGRTTCSPGIGPVSSVRVCGNTRSGCSGCRRTVDLWSAKFSGGCVPSGSGRQPRRRRPSMVSKNSPRRVRRRVEPVSYGGDVTPRGRCRVGMACAPSQRRAAK